MISAYLKSPPALYILKLAALTLVYAAAGYLTLLLIPRGATGAIVVWLPGAIGMASLVLGGLSLWPGIFIGLLSLMLFRQDPPLAIAFTAANTLESVAGAYILSYVFKLDTTLQRFRDIAGLFVASLCASIIAASAIAVSLELINETSFNASLWISIVVAHTMSLFSLTPVFITWFNGRPFIYRKWQIAEKVFVIGCIVTLNILLFWTPFTQLGPVSLIYILFIFLIWSAVRLSMRGMSLAIALTAIIGASGIVYGIRTTPSTQADPLFSLQIFIGVISLIFLVFSSITEERRTAVNSLQEYINKLESLLSQIRAADTAKNEFLAILAHELRNPLAPIVSSVEIMKEDLVPATEHKKLLDIVETHVRTMARLLDDLLDISRISQRKFELHTSVISLQSVVQVTLQTVDTYINARNHKLVIDMPKEPLLVEGDMVRLEQALVNLLNNAAKYTEPGGTITLTAEKRGTNAVIYITDTGIGIPNDIQHLIFEPFSTTSSMRRPGGLGVGLYLTKRLIELHHGTIGVVSEGKDKGSKFILTIPLAETKETVKSVADVLAQNPLPAAPAAREKTKKILIVDDNEPAVQGLRTLLTHSGHDTITALTGAEALSKTEHEHPTVVLLDIGLPDMEGYEVAKQIRRQHGQHITLVALTGYGLEDDKRKAREAGFNHHLTKPVGIADVQKILLSV